MKYAKGMALESIVERAAQMYEHYGIAHIFKRATGMSITGKFIGQAGVDFNGLIKGGQYIGIETKEVKTTNFNLQLIYEHQVKELRAIKKLGGHAFLLIRFSDTDEFFMVPLGYVDRNLQGFKQQIRKGTKNPKTGIAKTKVVSKGVGVLNREDMREQGFLIKKNQRNVYIDFLDGIA